MANKNKRGFKNSKSKREDKKVKVVLTEQVKAKMSSQRKTRSSISDEPKKDNQVNHGQSKEDSASILAIVKDIKNQLEQTKQEVQNIQENSARELQDALNQAKSKYQDLKNKYREKKTDFSNLELVRKDLSGKVELLEAETKSKMHEITELNEKIINLTRKADDLIAEGNSKEKEYKNQIENLLAREKEALEESLSNFVSKVEYNNLVDEYEKLKSKNDMTEKRLAKVLSDKRQVEKSKLGLMREKNHQAEEFIDIVKTFRNELKSRSSNEKDDRVYDQSRDHSDRSGGPLKRFKRYY